VDLLSITYRYYSRDRWLTRLQNNLEKQFVGTPFIDGTPKTTFQLKALTSLLVNLIEVANPIAENESCKPA